MYVAKERIMLLMSEPRYKYDICAPLSPIYSHIDIGMC